MKMHGIDHTHPHTGSTFGRNYYDAGTVAADGGRDAEKETMADINHEPAVGATRAFERGEEEKSVE